jgi:hypothetical protein
VPQELYYQHQNILSPACRTSFVSSNIAINLWIATHIRAERNGTSIHQTYNSQNQRNTNSFLVWVSMKPTFYWVYIVEFHNALLLLSYVLVQLYQKSKQTALWDGVFWTWRSGFYIAASGPEHNTKSVLTDSVINKMDGIKTLIRNHIKWRVWILKKYK